MTGLQHRNAIRHQPTSLLSWDNIHPSSYSQYSHSSTSQKTPESPPYSCLHPKYRSPCLSERWRRKKKRHPNTNKLVKPYKCFQSQGCVKQNLTKHAYCLLSCWDNSTLKFFPLPSSVTLHQGQGHQHEHEHICHAKVYLHAQFECHIVQDITIKLEVKKLSRCSCDLEWR